MFNLSNSKIFSCEIMRGLPKEMLDITKDFFSSLDDMLKREFRDSLDATIQQVALNRNYGENALSLDGHIHTEDSINYANFSVSYDIFINYACDKAKFVIKDSLDKPIFSEYIDKEDKGHTKILEKVSTYLHEKKNNGLI